LFVERGVLASFYDHCPSDHTEGALAVRYLSAEISVGRGAENFSREGQMYGERRERMLYLHSQIDGLAGPPPTVRLNADENRIAA
jgi:hypothetical protein